MITFLWDITLFSYAQQRVQIKVRIIGILEDFCFLLCFSLNTFFCLFFLFDAHTNPLFAQHKLIKLQDIVFLYTACFMYHFSKSNLPNAFNNFFTPINTRHKYNTRLASKSTFAFPIIRTNYGRFNIRFFGPKVWNEIDESLKSLSFRCFKRELKAQPLRKYSSA